MTTTKKMWALLIAAVLSLTLSMVSPAEGAPPAEETLNVEGPRSLGIPLRDTLLIGGEVGELPDGTQVIWSVVSGSPAYLHAVDPTTGEIHVRIALPGGQGSYAVRQAPDGTLYVATYNSARLFRIAPGATVAEDLGNPLPRETYIWSLLIAPDGKLYGGTSPGGRIFSYDPATGDVRDYGQLAAGQTYVKSLGWHDGKLYGGAYADWVITELDSVTGEKRTIALPEGLDPKGKVVYDINIWDGYLYARGYSAFAGTLHVYDLAADRWVHSVTGAAGLDVSAPGDDGRVWFFRQYEAGSAELVGFDPRTGEIERTGLMAYGRIINSRGIGWAEVDDPDYPGQSIVALGWRSLMFRYNPTTGAKSTLRAQVPGEPTPVLALGAGEDGTVWTGGFLQGGIANTDVSDGSTEYRRFSQVESLLWDDGRLVIGAYPDARVYLYDTALPWFSPEYADTAPTETANPPKILDLRDHVQNRLKGLATTRDYIVSGSTPRDDTLGGTIAVMDRTTGEVKAIHDQVIQDEGIFNLTSDSSSNVVYGVTTIAGGLSTTKPTQPSATVFAFDAATGEVLWETHPDTNGTYQAITMDGLGQLWAIATGRVLQLDPATGEILRTIETGRTGSFEVLALNDDGTTIYALTGGSTVTMIDAATGRSAHLLDQPGASKMVHTAGSLVFAVDIELIAWTVPDGFPEPVTVGVYGVDCNSFGFKAAGPVADGSRMRISWERDGQAQYTTVKTLNWWSGNAQAGWTNAVAQVLDAQGNVVATSGEAVNPSNCPVIQSHSVTKQGFGFKVSSGEVPAGAKLTITWTRGGHPQTTTVSTLNWWSGANQTGWAGARAVLRDASGEVIAKSGVIQP